MIVKRWTSPNDANHKNCHAEVDGVEFFRFPYSPFMARVGRFTATVSSRVIRESYYANVHRPDPTSAGTTLLVHHEKSTDQDELFVWAAAQMKVLDTADKGARG